MKNTLICKALLILAIVLTCGLHTAAAQENFEGIIEYRMQVEGNDLSPEIVNMIPKQFTIYLKNAHSRLEMQTGMSDITVLGDNASNSAVTLMDIMGNKVAIKTDSTQLNKAMEQVGEYEIQYLDDEKEIMGYDCKKAIIIRGTPADTSEVWYTKELLPIYPAATKFLPEGNWFPMMVHAKQHGVETTVTVQKISEGPLEDSLFKIPEGYKIVEQANILDHLKGQ